MAETNHSKTKNGQIIPFADSQRLKSEPVRPCKSEKLETIFSAVMELESLFTNETERAKWVRSENTRLAAAHELTSRELADISAAARGLRDEAQARERTLTTRIGELTVRSKALEEELQRYMSVQAGFQNLRKAHETLKSELETLRESNQVAAREKALLQIKVSQLEARLNEEWKKRLSPSLNPEKPIFKDAKESAVTAPSAQEGRRRLNEVILALEAERQLNSSFKGLLKTQDQTAALLQETQRKLQTEQERFVLERRVLMAAIDDRSVIPNTPNSSAKNPGTSISPHLDLLKVKDAEIEQATNHLQNVDETPERRLAAAQALVRLFEERDRISNQLGQ